LIVGCNDRGGAGCSLRQAVRRGGLGERTVATREHQKADQEQDPHAKDRGPEQDPAGAGTLGRSHVNPAAPLPSHPGWRRLPATGLAGNAIQKLADTGIGERPRRLDGTAIVQRAQAARVMGEELWRGARHPRVRGLPRLQAEQRTRQVGRTRWNCRTRALRGRQSSWWRRRSTGCGARRRATYGDRDRSGSRLTCLRSSRTKTEGILHVEPWLARRSGFRGFHGLHARIVASRALHSRRRSDRLVSTRMPRKWRRRRRAM
jgi:hypothetical protein